MHGRPVWQRSLATITACTLALILIPFGAFMHGRSLALDRLVTDGLHSLSAAWLTSFMKLLSTYAYHSVHWWIIGGVGLYFLLRRRSLWEAITLVAIRFGSDFAQEHIKNFYARPRPALDWVKPSSTFSYPSGTVTVGAAICLGLAYVIAEAVDSPKAKAWIIRSGWGLSALIALSRIYLGAHWLTDTLGALALATAVTTLAILPIRLRAKPAVDIVTEVQRAAAAARQL